MSGDGFTNITLERNLGGNSWQQYIPIISNFVVGNGDLIRVTVAAGGTLTLNGACATPTPIPSEATFQYAPGWNAYVPSLEPQPYALASELAAEMDAQGIEVLAIAKFEGSWKIYRPGFAISDFALQPAAGYLVYSGMGGTFTEQSVGYADAVSFLLNRGGNLVSIVETNNIATASDFCFQILLQGGVPASVSQWTDDGWLTHACDLPFAQFLFDPATAYFVQMESSITFTP
jgi:hypothetical protein